MMIKGRLLLRPHCLAIWGKILSFLFQNKNNFGAKTRISCIDINIKNLLVHNTV